MYIVYMYTNVCRFMYNNILYYVYCIYSYIYIYISDCWVDQPLGQWWKLEPFSAKNWNCFRGDNQALLQPSPWLRGTPIMDGDNFCYMGVS